MHLSLPIALFKWAFLARCCLQTLYPWLNYISTLVGIWLQLARLNVSFALKVMDARQDQISSKMADVRAQQEESLRKREELLLELEQAKQLTRREVEETERRKTARKEELEAQVGNSALFSQN